MIKKLRRKFIIITMLVITFVIFTIVGVINVGNYIRFNKDAKQIISVIVENKGEMPKPIDDEHPLEGHNTNKKDFDRYNLYMEIPYRTRFFTVLIDSNNNTTVTSNNTFLIDNNTAVDMANNVSRSSGYYDNYKYVVSKDSTTGEKLYVFLDCEQELSSMNTILKTSILISAIAISAMFVLIFIFSNMAVKPIAESYEKQKRFITNANHEIKTPLTIIGATNEIMEMQYGPNEWSESISNQVKRLTELTNELTMLSRLDENDNHFEMSNLALSNIVSDVASSFSNMAKVQNKEYLVNITPNIECKGNEILLSRLVMILLDNAFKYSNDLGKISISLEMVSKKIKLTVCNTVDQIEKGNLDILFDRFYRLDKSRNSQTGGSGIGLSIAKEISSIHSAQITAKSEDGKSLQIDFLM